ncbi:uncharacterized protein EV420DRAFT_493194 [Desarmillaria tabescens]|uniref:Uncharacterized protein n=1 Tax=Armillaria tabescens TaxID=1929756 RepID=A0AA39N4A9_ARMTA|nr:uncharacterized protein EV420DRAFT_493194 [Desarmillaria tabescens]KAK0457427.1 hypothetical protein EV420DRAFT_493194 [Desarmillaria tabescens]
MLQLYFGVLHNGLLDIFLRSAIVAQMYILLPWNGLVAMRRVERCSYFNWGFGSRTACLAEPTMFHVFRGSTGQWYCEMQLINVGAYADQAQIQLLYYAQRVLLVCFWLILIEVTRIVLLVDKEWFAVL